MFGVVLLNAALGRFTILCRREAEIRRTLHFDECCVVCVKKSGNIPRVATPLLSSANLPRTGLFQPLGDIDKFGGGRYRSDDFEFLIVGKKDFRDDDVPYNVFLSLCAVVERGTALETAELQVNMLGGISLVNCFKASLPNGLVLNEENLGLVSGDGSWYLDRVNERIELRVPSKMRSFSESFFKGRIQLPATNQGVPVIFGRSENRLRLFLFINRAGIAIREKKAGRTSSYSSI